MFLRYCRGIWALKYLLNWVWPFIELAKSFFNRQIYNQISQRTIKIWYSKEASPSSWCNINWGTLDSDSEILKSLFSLSETVHFWWPNVLTKNGER